MLRSRMHSYVYGGGGGRVPGHECYGVEAVEGVAAERSGCYGIGCARAGVQVLVLFDKNRAHVDGRSGACGSQSEEGSYLLPVIGQKWTPYVVSQVWIRTRLEQQAKVNRRGRNNPIPHWGKCFAVLEFMLTKI
jgi:hypothetical protein